MTVVAEITETEAAVAEPAAFAVREPGVYGDMPEQIYHADPVPEGSLSSSGARKLLPPSCPAKFRYEQLHPSKPTAAMNLGTAAHKMVLGAGAPIVVVDAPDWRTNDAKQQRKNAEARGFVALLPPQYTQVQEMAKAVQAHPLARVLLDRGRGGLAEQSLFWVDAEFGVWCRSRLDWLPPSTTSRYIIVDFKTCENASPDAIRKHVENYGYHIQAACYVEAVEALGIAEDPGFLHVFQETVPPYLVTVAQLDEEAMWEGQRGWREALHRYRDCKDSNIWPGPPYANEIQLISLPPWARKTYSEES